MFRPGDGPLRFSDSAMPPGVQADTDYVVVDVGSSMIALERSRRRRGLKFLATWAVARAGVAAIVAVWTGEWTMMATIWGALTYFHVERVTGAWR